MDSDEYTSGESEEEKPKASLVRQILGNTLDLFKSKKSKNELDSPNSLLKKQQRDSLTFFEEDDVTRKRKRKKKKIPETKQESQSDYQESERSTKKTQGLDFLTTFDPDLGQPNPDDVDRYREKFIKLEIKAEQKRTQDSKKLETIIVLLSIIPYFVGLLVVSLASSWTFDRTSIDVLDTVQSSLNSTSQSFNKHIAQEICQKIVTTLDFYITGVYDIRNYLT